MALKCILRSARAVVATCLRMVLFYLISFSPNLALALHMHLAEGGLSGGEWGTWQFHLFPEAYTAPFILSTAESYSPLSPAAVPPATPRAVSLRTAAAEFVGLPAAHTAPKAAISVSQADECSAAITSAFLGNVFEFYKSMHFKSTNTEDFVFLAYSSVPIDAKVIY